MSRLPSSPSLDDHTLREAFAAIRLETASSPRNSTSSARSELSDVSSTRRRHSELATSSGTVQAYIERRTSLEELWNDSNSNYTLSCLESQFKQMHEIDMTKLTRDDYEDLLQANFLALNKEIVQNNMTFIKEVQLHENMQRRLQLQMQQPIFDPQYSANLSANEAYYKHVPYTPMDPLSNGHHSRNGSSGNASSSRNSLELPPVPMHHGHVYYSPYPPPMPEEFPDLQHTPGGRSASWSSPMREAPADTSQTRPRGTSHADYTPYHPGGMGMPQHYPELFPGNADASSSSSSRRYQFGQDTSPPRSSRESPRDESPAAESR